MGIERKGRPQVRLRARSAGHLFGADTRRCSSVVASNGVESTNGGSPVRGAGPSGSRAVMARRSSTVFFAGEATILATSPRAWARMTAAARAADEILPHCASPAIWAARTSAPGVRGQGEDTCASTTANLYAAGCGPSGIMHGGFQ